MTLQIRRHALHAGLLIAILALIYAGIGVVMAPILRHRLSAMVCTHLNARLQIGTLHYYFPFTLSASDVSLVAEPPGHEPTPLLQARHVDLRLARFPRRTGPLVIERLILSDPTLNLIRTEGGIIGQSGLLKPHRELPPGTKLSDMFRLRQFALKHGRVVFTDRLHPDIPPMNWLDLNLDLHTIPRSVSAYEYILAARNEPLAKIDSTGRFDLDERDLDVADLALALRISPGAPSKLPSELQQLLAREQVCGALNLTGRAAIPFGNLAASRFEATLDLPSATAQVSEAGAALDHLSAKLRIATDPPPANVPPPTAPTPVIAATDFAGPCATLAPVVVSLESLEAASGDQRLAVRQGTAILDFQAGTWRIRNVRGSLALGPDTAGLPERARLALSKLRPRGTLELTATAAGPLSAPPAGRALDEMQYQVDLVTHDFCVQPDKYPLPITHIAGAARILPTVACGHDLDGYYGADHLFLTAARIPLPIVNHEIHFDEIDGTVDFAGKPQDYPLALHRLFDILRPAGHWVITGNYLLRPLDVEHRYEYSLGISADHGAITPSPLRIPITDIRCDMTGSGRKNGNGVWYFNVDSGRLLGGIGSGTGQVETGRGEAGPMLDYNGVVTVRDAELEQLAHCLAPASSDNAASRPSVAGHTFVDVRFNGTGPYEGRTTADNLRAGGEFQITDGRLGEVPVLRDVLAGTREGTQAVTLSQAAGTFEVRNRIVTLDRVAISAPILGLEGDGGVSFAGDLDLHVIAAPLADWEQQLRRFGIPLVGDAAGAVAGGIQKLLNGASRALLYEFRIGGKVSRPEVMAVPAPALSDSAAALFGQMITPAKDRQLIEAVREVR